MNLEKEGYLKAVSALKNCISKKGLYASGTPAGYRSIWSRDSNIALLGGSLIQNKFKKVFHNSLTNLARHQARSGQIPNAIGVYDNLKKSYVTYNTIDSSLWFIIGAYVYAAAYKDKKILKELKDELGKAFRWVTYQDVSEEHLPAQLPTMDWQDAFPHKYGHTINTQSLYYATLKFMGMHNEANHVKQLVGGNRRPHLRLFDNKRGYFLPWAWKDHAGDREEEHWFDSLGNLLAITTGLATSSQAKKILNYIEQQKINRPYPIESIFPSFKPRGRLWKSYFSKSDAGRLHHYLNGGIWPFIGGFYIAALVKIGKLEEAQKELKYLAEANKVGKKIKWEFNEWLDGKTGKPNGGIYQAWSIGMYIFAFECVKRKRVPFFSS